MSSQRITVRLDERLHNLLKKGCDASGQDTTSIVRMALESFFAKSEEGQPQDPSEVIMVPPDEIYGRVGPYFAWSGDLRKELNRLFIETLTVSFAAKKHFPRTEGIKEVYDGLLQISKYVNCK